MLDVIGYFVFLMLIVVFAFDTLVLIGIFEIKKSNHDCQCAKNSYVSKISVSVIIMCIMLSLMFLIGIIMSELSDDIMKNIMNLLLFIMFIIVYIICPYSSAMMFKMSKQIEKDNCDCLNSTIKNLLKYYSILRLTPFIILLMIMLYLFLEMILFLFPLK